MTMLEVKHYIIVYQPNSYHEMIIPANQFKCVSAFGFPKNIVHLKGSYVKKNVDINHSSKEAWLDMPSEIIIRCFKKNALHKCRATKCLYNIKTDHW